MKGERKTFQRMPKLKIRLLEKEAKVPLYAHETDAAFDIFTTEEKTLSPGERYAFSTGIASEIPAGYFVKFADKSGLALNNGITVLAGVIDADYRGEWKVILLNTGSEPIKFQKGDKVAQGILFAKTKTKLVVVSELSETERGEGGFGSTGRK